MRSSALRLRASIFFLTLALGAGKIAHAQQSADSSGGSSASTPSAAQGISSPGSSLAPTPASPGTPSDSSLQVTPPSVTLPTPALPPLVPNAEPNASPQPEGNTNAQANTQAAPTPAPAPQFNPPTPQNLNLASAQPAGNPNFAPASVGMPSMTLDNSPQVGSGALGSMFDWAKKLRFQAALRGGYDSDVNSGNGSNAIASTFANLNGGVNYRFGSPRLNINLNLTGGLTRYFKPNITQATQGSLGLGLAVEYRFNPKTVIDFNSSSSYQQNPNPTLAGTANNSGNNGYYYTANSLAAAYQWSDLMTTITTLGQTASYYPGQTNQGFSQPSFTQSFRYLASPTTTAVIDYNAQEYLYQNSQYNSFGQYLALGFDHTFNPKWFWNLRLGAQTQSSKSESLSVVPYLDSNFNWILGQNSSISWVAHIGTEPSGQSNVSYVLTGNTGINYTQGLFTKLKFNAGIFYQLNQYKNAPVPGLVQKDGQYFVEQILENYNQTNIQANIGLSYLLNRIITFSLGYQYTTLQSPTLVYEEYNRGVTYLQVSAGF